MIRYLAYLMLGLLAAAAPLRAASLDELISAGRLELGSSLDIEASAVPGQKVKLRISVATDSWFAGGTRIELPEVAGLVLLQSEAFAANSTESRRGQAWVVQVWTVDVYATGEGEYDIGPLALQLHIATDDGIASGTAYAPPTQLTVATPASLGDKNWVAAPRFVATQTLSSEPTELTPGDAIIRTITLEAEDVLDKMLPVVEAQAFDGLAAYSRPAQLSTRSNRGQSTAQRVQEITYVAEQPGTYTLPAYQFVWWDTRNATEHTVLLEAIELSVQGTRSAAGSTPQWDQGLRRALPTIGTVVAVLLVCWAAIRYLPWREMRRLAVLGWIRLQTAWRQWRAPVLTKRMNPWR